jgi:hypothetical protein
MPTLTTESGHRCQLDQTNLRAAQPEVRGQYHFEFLLPKGEKFEVWHSWTGSIHNAAQVENATGETNNNWMHRHVLRHMRTKGMLGQEGLNQMLRGVYPLNSEASYALVGKALAKMGVTACVDPQGEPDVPVLTLGDAKALIDDREAARAK